MWPFSLRLHFRQTFLLKRTFPYFKFEADSRTTFAPEKKLIFVFSFRALPT